MEVTKQSFTIDTYCNGIRCLSNQPRLKLEQHITKKKGQAAADNQKHNQKHDEFA